MAVEESVDPCAAESVDDPDRPIAVYVDDLHVEFEVYSDTGRTFRKVMSDRFRGREATVVKAVQGVSNVIYEGEAIGIVGSNGSGKSTLLSAVAGLIAPSAGEVRVSAQPALLGVHAALNPELSGRRNIVIGALAMGLPMAEVRENLDEVAEFASLGEAMNRSLITYSSGMKARLAFSIATLRTPEILLIDEALAVGDQYFRQKSLGRLREVQAEAGTILMVTHNLDEIRETCTRVLWLDQGCLRADGDVEAVLAEYEADKKQGRGGRRKK